MRGSLWGMNLTMKKAIAVLVVAAATVPVTEGASQAVKPKHYKNCTALNKHYPHGVAKNAKSARKQEHRPVVNKKVYKLNKSSDRDHDGTACER